MRTVNLFKVVLFLLLGSSSLAAQDIQLANMPTKETCNCKVYEAYQQTKSALKIGKVIVYGDGIVIKFGATSKTLYKINDSFYVDDKDKVWNKHYDKDSGYYSIYNSKIIYVYKEQDEN
jgi:hypothetical protein